jgi:hypothetical protein
MVRYFYTWIPLVIVGTIVILVCPWLGLIALLAGLSSVLAAVGALAWATVSALGALARSLQSHTTARASRERAETSPRVALHAGGVGGGGTR